MRIMLPSVMWVCNSGCSQAGELKPESLSALPRDQIVRKPTPVVALLGEARAKASVISRLVVLVSKAVAGYAAIRTRPAVDDLKKSRHFIALISSCLFLGGK